MEILTQNIPYADVRDLNTFVAKFRAKTIKPIDYIPEVPPKLKKLLENIFDENPSNRPSFEYIGQTLDEIIESNE